MNGTLDWVDEPHRYKILYRGRLLTAYNKGNPQYGDFFKAFPNIEPVHTLSGLPVTASGAANFNHHKSIFLGLGRLNGHNFYHDCYPPFALYRPFPSGDIVLVDAKLRTENDAVALETRNEWVPKVDVPEPLRKFFAPAEGTDGSEPERICTEHRTVRVALGSGCYTIDIDSEFEATDGELYFGQDGHSYLGIRVADALDEEDGGLVTDSTGRSGCDAINEQVADWVDYSGSLGEHALGITVMNHPANLPTLFRARAYGFFGPSPFFDTDHRLPAGGRLLFRYRVVVHDGDARRSTCRGCSTSSGESSAYFTRAAHTSYSPCSLTDWNTAQRLSRVTCTLVSKRPARIFSRGMLRKRHTGVVVTT